MTPPVTVPPRRAPRDLPSLPALRTAVQPPRLSVIRPSRSLAEAVEPYLFWLAGVRGRTALTIASYRKDLACFVAFCRALGLTDPAAVRHQHIEFYLAWLREQGGRQAATAARRLSCLRGFFRYLEREGLIARDPAALAYGPRYARQRIPVYLTVPEQERVLAELARDETLQGRRDYAAVATLLFTGLRVSEFLRLELGHVDLETGILRVLHGKGGKAREVVVIPRLRAILRTYLREVRPALPQAAASAHLFSGVSTRGWRKHRAGQPMERHWLSRLIGGRVSGILGRKVHPHALRHSYASRLREAGADLALIQEQLGHAELSTTMIYAHLSTGKRHQDVARLLDSGGFASGSG